MWVRTRVRRHGELHFKDGSPCSYEHACMHSCVSVWITMKNTNSQKNISANIFRRNNRVMQTKHIPTEPYIPYIKQIQQRKKKQWIKNKFFLIGNAKETHIKMHKRHRAVQMRHSCKIVSKIRIRQETTAHTQSRIETPQCNGSALGDFTLSNWKCNNYTNFWINCTKLKFQHDTAEQKKEKEEEAEGRKKHTADKNDEAKRIHIALSLWQYRTAHMDVYMRYECVRWWIALYVYSGC